MAQKQVKCIFKVASVVDAGEFHKAIYEDKEIDGQVVKVYKGTVPTGQRKYNVQASPWYNPDPTHPNRIFFESTPSGQFQVFNSINFAPPVGTDVEILLTWDEPDSN